MIIAKLNRAMRSPILLSRLWGPLISRSRKTFLKICAFCHGGKVKFSLGVKIRHKTKFQGMGRVFVGENVTFGYFLGGSCAAPILIQPRDVSSEISIGRGTTIMNGCEFIAKMSICIGEDCLIGARTVIFDSDFHGILPDKRNTQGESLPVTIEDNVWIGVEAMILKGVVVGKDSVIAARSVVVKDVPSGAIVGGNPARIIGSVYARNT